MTNAKYLFFDLDGTICESRQIISREMKKKLLSLKKPIIVVSGAEVKRIKKQMNGVPCVMMGQNGNDAPDWKNELSKNDIKEIYRHLEKVSKFCNIPLDKDTVHNRGCQVSFSFTGHNADINWKKKFDPRKEFRRYVLDQVPFYKVTRKPPKLVVRIAGTTCLDYNRRDRLKGNNLRRYMTLHNLKKKDCIYYGDNFDEGGNDESVIGVMECVEVKNPNDLYKRL